MNNESQIDPGWQELINAFENGLIEPVKELIREYRFYYNELGEITQVSDCNWNHPETGNYVVVDEDMHINWRNYRVRNGQAELKPTDPTTELQLKKSDSGYPVVENNPAIIVESGETVEKMEYYDRRNS
jgi:hypothetical protein